MTDCVHWAATVTALIAFVGAGTDAVWGLSVIVPCLSLARESDRVSGVG